MEGVSGYQARSAGTQPSARIVVNQGHLGWADVIFVMEKRHLALLRRKFPEVLEGKKVVTLQIPDEFEFMQPELLEELRDKLAAHVQFPVQSGLAEKLRPLVQQMNAAREQMRAMGLFDHSRELLEMVRVLQGHVRADLAQSLQGGGDVRLRLVSEEAFVAGLPKRGSGVHDSLGEGVVGDASITGEVVAVARCP